MGPVSAVAAAARSVAARILAARTSGTRTPSDAAISSPSPSALRPPVSAKAAMSPTSPTSATGSAVHRSSRSAPVSDPTTQKRYESNTAGIDRTTAVMRACSTAVTTAPASTSGARLSDLEREPSAITTITATTAPGTAKAM